MFMNEWIWVCALVSKGWGQLMWQCLGGDLRRGMDWGHLSLLCLGFFLSQIWGLGFKSQ